MFRDLQINLNSSSTVNLLYTALGSMCFVAKALLRQEIKSVSEKRRMLFENLKLRNYFEFWRKFYKQPMSVLFLNDLLQEITFKIKTLLLSIKVV